MCEIIAMLKVLIICLIAPIKLFIKSFLVKKNTRTYYMDYLRNLDFNFNLQSVLRTHLHIFQEKQLLAQRFVIL